MLRVIAMYGPAMCLVSILQVDLSAIAASNNRALVDVQRDELFIAIRHRDTATVTRLLKAGVDPNMRFGDSAPSILLCPDGGTPSFCRSFTPMQAVALPSDKKLTAPMGTSRRMKNFSETSQLAIAMSLLRHGADPSLKNEGLEDPLGIALANGNDSLAQLLVAMQYGRLTAVAPETSELPSPRDCVPFLPRTLGLVLELRRDPIPSDDLSFMFSALTENEDWESCIILATDTPDNSLDPIVLARFLRKKRIAGLNGEIVERIEVQLRAKTTIQNSDR
ncbi:MAG: hypothetical protein ABGZ53_03220 [Fuerstiella sp.]